HDHELATAPRPLATNRDASAMQLDEPLRDREPDAEAALRAIERLIALHEQIEDVRQDLRIDADALIAHANLHDALDPRQTDLNAPLVRRELRCIRQQVADHLREPVRIAVDDQ